MEESKRCASNIPRIAAMAGLAMATLIATSAVADENTTEARVVILATGGTIAGSAETQPQAGYTSGQVGVEVLISANHRPGGGQWRADRKRG